MKIASRYYLPLGLTASAGVHLLGALLLPTLLRNRAPVVDALPAPDAVTLRLIPPGKPSIRKAVVRRVTAPSAVQPSLLSKPPIASRSLASTTPPPVPAALPSSSTPIKPTAPVAHLSAALTVAPPITPAPPRPTRAPVLMALLHPRPQAFSLPTRVPESNLPSPNVATVSVPVTASPETVAVSNTGGNTAPATMAAASPTTSTPSTPSLRAETTGSEKHAESSEGHEESPVVAQSPVAAPAPRPSLPLTRAKPRYRTNPKPDYPDAARRRHEEGVVRLLVAISEDGRVTDASIEQSSGFDDLDAAALSSVRQWEFEPARRGDTREASKAIVPVRFGQE